MMQERDEATWVTFLFYVTDQEILGLVLLHGLYIESLLLSCFFNPGPSFFLFIIFFSALVVSLVISGIFIYKE